MLKRLLSFFFGSPALVAAAFLFACMGLLVKLCVEQLGVNIFWLGFLRFAIASLIIGIPGHCGAYSLKVNNRPLFVLRGVIGSTGNFLLFVAIALVGLGRGTVLIQLMGVFGALSAIFILHERLSVKLISASVIATLGVFMCCGFSLTSGYEFLALIGAVCSGLTLSFIRKLRQTDNTYVVFFSQCIFGSLLLFIPALMSPVPTQPMAWVLIPSLTLVDIAAQLFMTRGLATTPVAIGGSLLMLSPGLSLLAGLCIFKEPINAIQLSGCLLILVGSFLATTSPRQFLSRFHWC